MIVVSDLDVPIDTIQRIPCKEFIASISETDDPKDNVQRVSPQELIVNISQDYRYMKMGYYCSVHAELLGNQVYPKSEDSIDVYRPPILLIRAMKAGIKVVPNILTGSVKDVLTEFSLPVLLFPVKPSQTYEIKIVKTKGALYNEMKKMTMNGGYVVCVQPLFGELVTYKAVFGYPVTKEGEAVENPGICQIAMQMYDEFKIPLFEFLVQIDKDQIFLCAINPYGEEDELKLNSTEIDFVLRGLRQIGENVGQ